MRLWNKIKDIDLLCQEQLILQCHATYFLSLTQQNHCIRISAFLKVKKEQATEEKFHPPSPSNVLFFMLFLTCYQTLNLTKKPQCIKVLKFWELPMLFLKSCRTVRSTLKGTSVSSRHLIFLSPYSHAPPAPTFLAQITCFQTLHSRSRIPHLSKFEVEEFFPRKCVFGGVYVPVVPICACA